MIIFKEEFKGYERINKGHSCYRAEDAKYCLLHPNLILSVNDLQTAEIVEFDNCDDRIRESFCPGVANNCTSKHPGYDCLCNKGFKAIETFYKPGTKYQYCEDIDECLDVNICGSNSNCINTVGNFTCSCIDGFVRNKNKNKFECEDIDECLDANICGSNSNCINTVGNFTCSCIDGFVRNKNKNEFECEVSGERKTRYVLSIVGYVLGTVLLLSLLFIIILAIRLRKQSKISQRSNESLENLDGRSVNQGSSHEILFQERTHHETNPVSIPRVNRYRKQLRNPSVRPIEHYEDYP
ncbi:adhesion G protein-coupled receptor E2-like isoform X3 [Centruroides sculpturatus]|uniref:adhesion G protein-coupled receptor E2-like isoform X3 n=1 Tax=Centruroides sculpturatus TaxID=218467 RepID=UPI000C6E745C|nr:adhesion G protein-coupled receptor E2-like isoform X3 [Centruroides sculpturatus]